LAPILVLVYGFNYDNVGGYEYSCYHYRSLCSIGCSKRLLMGSQQSMSMQLQIVARVRFLCTYEASSMCTTILKLRSTHTVQAIPFFLVTRRFPRRWASPQWLQAPWRRTQGSTSHRPGFSRVGVRGSGCGSRRRTRRRGAFARRPVTRPPTSTKERGERGGVVLDHGLHIRVREATAASPIHNTSFTAESVHEPNPIGW
jgi:hypothetical protein